MGVSAQFTLQRERLGVTHSAYKKKKEKPRNSKACKCGNVNSLRSLPEMHKKKILDVCLMRAAL